MICFFFVEETFDHVLGNKLDHVSLMFIPEHQCKYGTQNKFLQILFFNSLNKSFCNSKNLFNCKCISFPEACQNNSLKEFMLSIHSRPRVSNVNQCGQRARTVGKEALKDL